MSLEISLCIAYAVTALISWQYCRMRLGYTPTRFSSYPVAASALPAGDRFQRRTAGPAPKDTIQETSPRHPRQAFMPERKDSQGLQRFLRMSLRRYARATNPAGAAGLDWTAGDCWPRDPAGYRWLVWAGRSE